MKARFLQLCAARWRRLYKAAIRSDMTFRQIRGLFIGQCGHRPPNGIPLMPINDRDWYRRVRDVEPKFLTSAK